MIGGRQFSPGEPKDGDQGKSRYNQRRQAYPRPGLDDLAPGRICGHTEQVGFDPVCRVGLGDVDPVLLGQLDHDPDERRRADHELFGHPNRIPAQAVSLIEDEEVLEGVREDQQQRPQLGQLE